MRTSLKTLSALVGAGLVVGAVAGKAHAQGNPELGDVGAPAWGPPPEGEAEAGGSVSASGEFSSSGEASASSSSTRSAPSGSGAHADVVGKFGIGFFGITQVPVCFNVSGGGGCDQGEVAAPAIGMRYWLNETIGIEAGLGIGISSGTETVQNGGMTTERLETSTTAFVLHGGLPIALAYSGNFVFQVVPEMNLGIASGTIYDNSGAQPPNDVDISGLLFQLGGRAGAEIHFGFIGLPQLSLQATVGLHLTMSSRSASVGALEVSRSRTNISTTVQNNPWDIFTGSISAIYYFID